MHRTILGFVALVAFTDAGAQVRPPIANGQIQVREATDIGRELSALPSKRGEPVWAAWSVPIVAGQRGGCCQYADDSIAAAAVRGCFVDAPPTTGAAVPQVRPSETPIHLESTSTLVLLVRIIDGRIERLRSLGADCPLDADGRTLFWLNGPTPAVSIAFLTTLVGGAAVTPPGPQRLQEAALSSVALHQAPEADAVLDRLADDEKDSTLRRLARTLLGTRRGAHGFDTLRRLFQAERLADSRRQLIAALGQTHETATPDTLQSAATRDPDPQVRAEAAYWLPQRGGARYATAVRAIADSDSSDAVRQRAVQGLARMPDGDRVAVLIDLARTSRNLAVRKAAVSALGHSADPRATQYLVELLK